MVLELVSLLVHAGDEPGFERAFGKAQRLLTGVGGYLAHELRRSASLPQHYVLLIEWRAIEDRTLRFSHTPAHVRWRELLQPFLAEGPQAEFFHAVPEVAIPAARSRDRPHD